MEKFNPDGGDPRWHALILLPCGALAIALGVFSIYDRFWGGALPFSFNPVLSVLILGTGAAGIVSGFRQLLGV